MGAIVIKLQDKSELELVLKVLSKMKIKFTFISESEMERMGMVNAIDEGRKTEEANLLIAKKLLR